MTWLRTAFDKGDCRFFTGRGWPDLWETLLKLLPALPTNGNGSVDLRRAQARIDWLGSFRPQDLVMRIWSWEKRVPAARFCRLGP